MGRMGRGLMPELEVGSWVEVGFSERRTDCATDGEMNGKSKEQESNTRS